jgi:membrane dipeptidase
MVSHSNKSTRSEPEELHQEAIVIDATCPLARQGNSHERWIAGGATAIVATVDQRGDFISATMRRLGAWFKRLQQHSDRLLHVTSVQDIYRAKEEKKLGIIFQFQDTLPFEQDVAILEVYHRLGVRIVQLCYNTKNFVGDGCSERTDCGLSDFGVRVIAEMNRLGITVDCAHTGYRTTMDAIEASKRPVIISHANVRAVCDSFRNLRDDQIKAVAAKGGTIGITGFPPFVAKKARSSLNDLLDHVDYIAKLVGVEFISIGMDYWEYMAGVCDDSTARARYDELVRAGLWNPRDYPPPPFYYPEGVEVPERLPNLTGGLLKRGYSREDVKAILGRNLMRVMKEVWGPR